MPNHVPLRSLLLLSLIQKRFLKTSASPSSFKVQYLIDSCGLPSQLALSTYQKFQHDKKNLPNAYSVLQYLKDHDFSNTHISKLIDKYPRVLQVRVGSNLKPKFDFFTENGFVA
jgi:mTERF domain-containing protein